jgi:inosose dehydratase
MNTNRRQFLATGLGAVATASLLAEEASAKPKASMPISCNSYNWSTFYGRQQKSWGENLDACIAEFATTGIKAYEPGLNGVEDVLKLVPVLNKYGIQLPSVYVNSVLHEVEEAEKSLISVLAIADEVKKAGTKIMVTNPTPLQWGSNKVKTDEQLKVQLKYLELLGSELRKKGIKLAYHTHDVELKAGAREFHHMLQNTSPENVGFCFDIHWVYRGSDNSELAVFDALKMYGNRIVELHLRQSQGGIWTETLGEGDINLARLAAGLKNLKQKPHFVIEQAVEKGSPNTMDGVQAHVKSLAYLKATFGI